MQAVDELEVYQAGRLTVVGFGGREILDPINLAACYDELMELIHIHECQTLVFDFTGVRWIPSGLLGILMSMRRLNIELHLYNPSSDIQEVLEITKLNQCLQIHEIEI